jgi:hypothetical protein
MSRSTQVGTLAYLRELNGNGNPALRDTHGETAHGQQSQFAGSLSKEVLP